ncbi:MAG: Hpt domain-containing protein [Clostridiales bacterium]|nr:Hpt domain-containing protein [Clostridiales bacterium]
MTLKECYAALGGDYDEAMGRLRSERLVQKFVLKFLDDGSYQLLCDSLASGNRGEAFRAAHTLKGVCANLAFNTLLESSERLTEALRDGKPPEAGEEALAAQVKEDYQRTRQAIEALQEGAAG